MVMPDIDSQKQLGSLSSLKVFSTASNIRGDLTGICVCTAVVCLLTSYRCLLCLSPPLGECEITNYWRTSGYCVRPTDINSETSVYDLCSKVNCDYVGRGDRCHKCGQVKR